MAQKKTPIEPHQWTDHGDKVLILRRVGKDGISGGTHAKFQWPEGVGMEVSAPDWNPEPKCGGGLHGWAWGMWLGDGMDYNLIDDRWMVIACLPGDVVAVEGKCKFRAGIKLYDGEFSGAWAMINSGRHRWMEASSSASQTGASSSAFQTGDRSSASQTGYRSSASQTGASSSASQTGHSSSASQTRYRSSASQTGASSSAFQTGDSSSASQTGHSSSAFQTEHSSSASQTGDRSSASQTGDRSSASQTGYRPSASQTGASSSASQTGYRSSASQTGDRSSASQTGYRSSASQTGDSSAIASTGLFCRARVGKNGAFLLAYKSGDEIKFLAGIEGENGIKANVWYEVRNGKLAEVIE